MTADIVTERLAGALPERSAAAAARTVAPDATVAVSGFGSVGDEIDTALVEAGAIARRYPFQARPAAREAINDGTVAFHDRHISTLGDEVAFGGLADVDVAIVEAVAVGEDFLVPSTSIGHTPAYVDAADRLVVEVNRAQPLDLARLHDVYRRAAPPDRDPLPLSTPDGRIGSPRVPFDPDKLDAVVTTDRPDSPYSFREPGETERAISDHLAEFLAAELDRNPILGERVHLQFGVGSVGNATLAAVEAVDFGDRRVAYFGEVIQDGLLDLLDDGAVKSASGTSLALSAEGQERLFADLDAYAGDIVVRPASVSNSPGLVDRFGVVGVNSALSVDVYGHVNSTHVGGTHVVNGVGGSADFTRNCPLAVVALPSRTDGGTSRVVPMVTHVDHTEHDVDVVVTEQGVADLRGLSPRERATELVSACAHPEVRGDLRAYLDRAASGGGHLPHDPDSAFDWR